MSQGSENFGIVVEFQVKPECLDRFNALIAENAHASVTAEAGCRQFDVLRDVDDPCRVLLYEIYDDRDAFTGPHMGAEHTKRFLAAAKELVVSQKAQRLIRTMANAKAAGARAGS
ncbi:MAG: putative quinol monooxygenase [Burkholderiaceae bacterium]